MSDETDALDSYSEMVGGGYGSASEGLAGYDSWKTTEPDDSDAVYYSTWEEVEARGRQMKQNAMDRQAAMDKRKEATVSTGFTEAFETETNGSSMSQDELITRYAELDERVKSLGAERRDIGLQIAGIAFEKKGEQHTVHLTSTGGQRVKCVFGDETEYITEELIEVSKMVGEQFDELFETQIEFKPKKRALKMFLNTVFPDEKLETAKQLIRDATVTKAKTPYVTVE